MRCSACGTENETGARFCDACGAALTAVCPGCGTANRPAARFCQGCGASIVGTAGAFGDAPAAESGAPLAANAAASRQAERRLVSLLFADLVGFTTLAEGRDPEETRELLTRYFDLARETITRYGGTVEKFIGDAVMAVWGTPSAHEDDAERAVRAALDLIDAVPQLHDGLQARAGVLTGEAAVTIGATGQGMVAGDPVNTASRLQSVALPGTVLVDEATERAASRAIVFEPAGEHLVKGRAAPVPAFRALRVVAERGGRNRSERLEAPFVGRDNELRLLKEMFHATGRERRVRLVSVSGVAGVGKSRLAWEFEKYLDGLVESVYWHHGRSPSYGDGITFWALGEMVRGRAGLLESDDEATTRGKVAEAVQQWVPDPAERPAIERALLALLGVEPAPPSGRDALFAAWRTFFERIGSDGSTVVLVFEDLQWADSGLLDFIDHVLDWSTGTSMLVLTLARPELLERRPDWGAGRRNFVAVHLYPLPVEAMRDLVTGLVPGLPAPAVSAIVDRADGIPLYAVETVRMLVMQGRLAEREGRYEPTGDLTTLAVPETLQALIGARLDSLDAVDRTLLQDAAVLGQSFTLDALAAVGGLDAGELERRLASLVRRELLVRLVDPRSPEHGQFAFVQALIREVAYATLSRRDRRARHLAAARHFEAHGDDELAGALAAHYVAAHQASAAGPEADAVAAQARISLRAAAERAQNLGSNEQALAFWEQALAMTPDEEDRFEVLLQAGTSASAAGRHGRAEELLRLALGQARASGVPERLATAGAALGRALMIATRGEVALELLEPLVAELQAAVPPADATEVQERLAAALFIQQRVRDALEVVDRVLPAAEAADRGPVIAEALITKGMCLDELGRGVEGAGVYRAGIELADRLQLPQTAMRGLNNLSALLVPRDPRGALDLARDVIADRRAFGDRVTHLMLAANAAEAAWRVGEWDWAERLLDSLLSEVLDPTDRALALPARVALAGLRGDPAEAWWSEIDAAVRATGDAQLLGMARLGRVVATVAAGSVPAFVEEVFEAARVFEYEATVALTFGGHVAAWERDVDALRRLLARHEETRRHGPAMPFERLGMRAGIAALEGRTGEALAAYRDVLRGWVELGLLLDEALTGMDMAAVLDPAEPEVRAAIDRSRETLEELRAAPLLARLDRILGSRSPTTRTAAARESSPVSSGRD